MMIIGSWANICPHRCWGSGMCRVNNSMGCSTSTRHDIIGWVVILRSRTAFFFKLWGNWSNYAVSCARDFRSCDSILVVGWAWSNFYLGFSGDRIDVT
jgi:hypothetical protein